MAKISKFRKSAFYLMVTALIVAMIIFAGPVSAVTVGIYQVSDTTPNTGDIVTFQAYVDIWTDEHVPIQNLTLIITAPQTGYSHTCWFYPNGSEIAGCDNITITLLTSAFNYTNATGWGYGYGYAYNATGWTTINTTYGYGYGSLSGYGYGLASYSELEYNISWNTTNYPGGSYLIEFRAEVDDGTTQFRYSTTTATSLTMSTTTTTTTSTTSTIEGSWGGSDGDYTPPTTIYYEGAGTTTTVPPSQKDVGEEITDIIEDIGKTVHETWEKTTSGSVLGDEGEPSEGEAQPWDLLIGVVVVIAVVGAIVGFVWYLKNR